MHSYVYSSTIHNSQIMEPASVSINRGMDNENVVYIHKEILLTHKEQNFVICKKIFGIRDYYAESGQSLTVKGQMIFLSMACWHTFVIPVPGRLRQEDPGFWPVSAT